MKKSMFAAMLATVAISAHAESDMVVNNPDNRPFFGVRASLDIPCPHSNIGDLLGIPSFKYKNGAGVDVRGIYNFPLVKNLYLEPGIGVYYDTYKDDELWVRPDEKADASVRNFGFRVPVMLGYHFDFTPAVSLAVFTGPMLDVGIVSDYHYSYTENGQDESGRFSLYTSNAGFMRKKNRVDCKWMFGAGLTLNTHYYVGVTGGVGMVNLTAERPTLRENLVQVSLGYNF